ncbi:MAG: hypothetical protein Q9222_003646 [Ikaeria aurantiellina]
MGHATKAASPSLQDSLKPPDSMPTYHIKSINLRLSVADLQETSTPNPVNRLCTDGINNANKAVKEFQKHFDNGILHETPLYADDEEYHLDFLGKHKDIPFLPVHVGLPGVSYPSDDKLEKTKEPPGTSLIPHDGGSQMSPLTDLPSSPQPSSPDTNGGEPLATIGSREARFADFGVDDHESDGNRSAEQQHPPRRGSRPIERKSTDDRPTTPSPSTRSRRQPRVERPPSSDPQALCLRLVTKPKSFLSTHLSTKAATLNHDLKIDVFLNGDLCSSGYITTRSVKQDQAVGNLFSGIRNGRHTEKSWILKPHLPEGPDSTKGSTASSQSHSEGIRRRWAEIGKKLAVAAESSGRNDREELSASGQYLESLASWPMPATLSQRLESTQERFAIIDVIVTTGKGRKEDVRVSYIISPTPLKLLGYGPHRAPKESPSTKPRKADLESRQTTEQPSTTNLTVADGQILPWQFTLPHMPRTDPNGLQNKISDKKLPLTISRAQGGRPRQGLLSIASSSEVSPVETTLNPEDSRSPATNSAISQTKKDMPKPSKTLDIPPKEQHSAASGRSLSPTKRQRSSDSLTLDSTSAPADTGRSQPKRQRNRFHDVVDTKRTAEEEIRAVVEQAKDQAAGFISDRLTTRSRFTNPVGGDSSANSTNDPSNSGESKVKEPQLKKPDRPAGLTLRTSELPSIQKTPAAAATSTSQSISVIDSIVSTPETPAVIHNVSPDKAAAPSDAATGGSTAPSPPAIHASSQHSPPGPMSPTLPDTAVSSSPESPLISRHKALGAALHPLPPPIFQFGAPAKGGSAIITSSTATTMRPPALPPTFSPQVSKKASKDADTAQKNQAMSSSKEKLQPPAKPAQWEIPPLSRDSVVTYAPEGIVRQIRSERGGYFDEERVMLGVRFVIG